MTTHSSMSSPSRNAAPVSPRSARRSGLGRCYHRRKSLIHLSWARRRRGGRLEPSAKRPFPSLFTLCCPISCIHRILLHLTHLVSSFSPSFFVVFRRIVSVRSCSPVLSSLAVRRSCTLAIYPLHRSQVNPFSPDLRFFVSRTEPNENRPPRSALASHLHRSYLLLGWTHLRHHRPRTPPVSSSVLQSRSNSNKHTASPSRATSRSHPALRSGRGRLVRTQISTRNTLEGSGGLIGCDEGTSH